MAASTLRDRFARAVRAARRTSGLSQAEAAERAGIAVEVYGRLERGAVLPRTETLVRIAQAFGVSCDALLGHDAAPGGLVVSRDAAPQGASPELRRVMAQLDGLSPAALRLLARTIRALRTSHGPGRDGKP